MVDQLLADGVVTTGIVVASVLLASDHLVGVEQASVVASSNFVDDIGLEIAVDGSRNIFTAACPSLSVLEKMYEV